MSHEFGPPADATDNSVMTAKAPDGRRARGFSWSKWLILVAAVCAAGLLYVGFGDRLTLASLAQHEAALHSWRRQHPVLIYAAALGMYVVVTGLSLPGATPLTLAYGWMFGFWRGLVLVSFASTAGATLAFLLSRYLFRDAVQRRYGDRLQTMNRAVAEGGAWYLISLRLIPAIPFFVLNLLMGLTPIRVATYWWASQLGMLPATAVIAYAGSEVPSLQELAERGAAGVLKPQILVALLLLGLLPLVTRFVVSRRRASQARSA